MNKTTATDALFEHAPLIRVQRRLGLIKPDNLNIYRRALLFGLIGWVPLILLAIVQSAVLHVDDVTPLLWQVGVHARYLLAVPLLVLAEAACVPRLNAIVRQFFDSGIVNERDRVRLDDVVASTGRLPQSSTVVVIALAYLVVLAALLSNSFDQLPPWAISGGITPIYSPVGWWHMLVSLPMLLVLIFGWMWRLALWARLLSFISHLELRIVASHPDHCAGLSFLGHSVRAFAIVVLALATIVAGRSAHMVLIGGALPTAHFLFNIAFMLSIMALFVAPLLVFTPTLMRTWRRGMFEYDALADRVGHAFERRWLGARDDDQGALEKPDFSVIADLYSVVANVHAIRIVPIDIKDIITLAVAVLLPFVPVVLLAFPLDAIWTYIKNLLF
jgi:hypothetical protein